MVIMILAAVVALLVVVVIHEYGHFWMARAVGIRVEKFSIGFGKALWKHKAKSGTEYIIAAVPLGGYVKMLGDEANGEVDEADKPYAYNHKPVWARFLVVAAGPLINFILAILLFWVVFFQGVVVVKPVVGAVTAGSPAAMAGFKAGDRVVSVNGKQIDGWLPMTWKVVEASYQKPLMVKVKDQAGKNQLRRLDLSHWQPSPSNPNLLQTIGLHIYAPKISPDVASVQPKSPAAIAGLKANDRIIELNGKRYVQWQPLVAAIRERPGQKVRLTVIRQGKTIELPVKLAATQINGKAVGQLGVMVKEVPLPASMLMKKDYTVGQALKQSVQKLYDIIRLNLIVIGKLFTGQLSVKILGGPITVFKAAGQASLYGWAAYVSFVAFINVSIGFVNLLPIPGLDGGHLVFLTAEAIRRKPLSENVQSVGIRLGFTALIFIMLLATYNDLMRIFFVPS